MSGDKNHSPFEHIPPDERAEAFADWIAQADNIIGRMFGLGPRDFEMAYTNAWPTPNDSLLDGLLRLAKRFGISDIINDMKAQGLEPIYVMACPETIRKYAGLDVEMDGHDILVIEGAVVFGLALVAANTIPPEAVMVADRRSLTASLGRGFEERIPRVAPKQGHE